MSDECTAPRKNTVQVQAHSLNQEGRALCSTPSAEGDDIVVDGLLPGETATVLLGRRRRGKREGRLVSIDGGPGRLPAVCPHVHACGGCRTQQWPSEAEASWKQRTMQRLFPEHRVLPMVSAPRRFEYRTKLECSFARNREGRLLLGLHARASQRIIDLVHCGLIAPWASLAVHRTRQWGEEHHVSAFAPKSGTGALRTLTLRHGARSNERMAILLTDHSAREEVQPLLQHWVEQMLPLAEHLIWREQIAIKGQPTRFVDTLLAGNLQLQDHYLVDTLRLDTLVGPADFAQPNPAVAELFYAEALSALDPAGGPVLDLFAGAGILGLLAAKKGYPAISVELHPPSCEAARALQALNQVAPELHQIVSADVGDFLRTLPPSRYQVLLDPPRAGCGPEVCRWLGEAPIERIVYIACNPVTQAQDCHSLGEQGFTVSKIQPYDQFPNTPHIESLVLLERATG